MPIPQSLKRFLQVETPQTTDGKTLAYDHEQRPIYKTTFLPVTAKTELLRNTSKLPEYLRPRLTEVSGDKDQTQIKAQQTEVKMEKRAESLGVQQTATPAPSARKGRPRKAVTT